MTDSPTPADLSAAQCMLCLYRGPDEDGVTRWAVHATGITGMSTGVICFSCWETAAKNPGGWKRLAADDVVCKRETLDDALGGWRFIRQRHGDLYGVGWDRVEQKLTAALSAKAGEAV